LTCGATGRVARHGHSDETLLRQECRDADVHRFYVHDVLSRIGHQLGRGGVPTAPEGHWRTVVVDQLPRQDARRRQLTEVVRRRSSR
jgi:hypothetical protein